MRRLAAACLFAFLASTTTTAQPATPDTVQELHVLVLLHTRSFSRALTPQQVERLNEEIVEFADFYRRHGGDRVAFRFSLLEVDRELRRAEVDEVAPGRYYLSREDVAAELAALGADTLGVDEVVAFYAWSDANPEGAALAYGGAAVGPDGGFLGDAGYNSIGVFAWNPGRIAQVAVHEVLHNLDDMFSRSGMPDAFLNSDEMSRNMPTLLAERPGAFEPFYTDPEMLAFARRESAGREMYPWWMQRIYYAWMLERTPREAWAALRYGRRAPAPDPTLPRPLYDVVTASAATHRIHIPVLAPRVGDLPPGLTLHGGGRSVRLKPLRYALEDFDGTPIVEAPYAAAWIEPGNADAELVDPRTGGPGRVAVRRYRQAEIVAPAAVTAYGEGDGTAPLRLQVREAGWPESGPPVERARVTATAPDGESIAFRPQGAGVYAGHLPASADGTAYVVRAEATGLLAATAKVTATRRGDWTVHAPATLEAPMGMPFNVRVGVRRDRALDATATATVAGREVPLERLPDRDYAANVDGLPPGLHQVVVTARRPDGGTAVDTIQVYIRARGWIRVPRRIQAAAGQPVEIRAEVTSRMGETVRGLHLPLVVVADDRVLPLAEGEDGVYGATLVLPAGRHRIYATSLDGEFQRRVILVDVASAGTEEEEP